MTEKLKPLKPYEPDWEHGYCTRDGRSARVICTDADVRDYPIIALICNERPNGDAIASYRSSGCMYTAKETIRDLMCAAPPEPEPLTVYVVQDKNGKLSVPCHTLEAAERHLSECAFHFGSLSPWEILTFVQKPEDAA